MVVLKYQDGWSNTTNSLPESSYFLQEQRNSAPKTCLLPCHVQQSLALGPQTSCPLAQWPRLSRETRSTSPTSSWTCRALQLDWHGAGCSRAPRPTETQGLDDGSQFRFRGLFVMQEYKIIKIEKKCINRIELYMKNIELKNIEKMHTHCSEHRSRAKHKIFAI